MYLKHIAQGAYRERTKQNETTGDRRRGAPQDQAGHGFHKQPYGTPGRLSNAHKSPLRYGSQNLSASSGTNSKGT